jgi:hypothetical protein
MRFRIGQQVWIANFQPMAPVLVTCPDCGGTGRLRVLFHDDTIVSIECRNCAAGYDPPTGMVTMHQRSVGVRKVIVTGVQMQGKEIEWHLDGTDRAWTRMEDACIFDNATDALAAAQEEQAKWEHDQDQRVLHKEKDTRTWAWNASYHRNCLKEAQRQIDYHTRKLSIASLKAKKDKAAAS